MKKVATALALAFAFAAPLAFSSTAVQASSVKTKTHMVNAVNGKKHKVSNHKANKNSMATKHKFNKEKPVIRK